MLTIQLKHRGIHHYDHIGLLPATKVTDAYREYEQKSKGKIKDQSPESAEAIALVKKLQNHITEHYYKCTDEILIGLGNMYAGGGDLQ